MKTGHQEPNALGGLGRGCGISILKIMLPILLSRRRRLELLKKFRLGDLPRLPVDITGQGGGPVIMIKSSRRKDKVLQQDQSKN